MISLSDLPFGSKSEPPLPPPIGSPVREFLNVCSITKDNYLGSSENSSNEDSTNTPDEPKQDEPVEAKKVEFKKIDEDYSVIG